MTQSTEPETLDFLLAQVCHLHYSRVRTLAEAIGLHRGQPPVLQALWDQEGLTHTNLAQRLRVTPATITKMLQRMEAAGFVVSRPDAEDQRVSRVYLTEAGRAIETKVETVRQAMDRETFDGLTPKERAALRRFLIRVRENLVRATGEKPWTAK